MSATCEFCDKQFTKASNMRKHAEKFHFAYKRPEPKLPPKALTRLLMECPICKITGTKQHLTDHFLLDHSIEQVCESLHFDTIELFELWKTQTEKETTAQFVKPRAALTRNDGSQNILYICSRSGYSSCQGTVRHEKLNGTSKIQGYCPAAIKVSVGVDGSVSVDYIKTHVGHALDLKFIRLTSEEREEIARKIASKIPFEVILDSIRESVVDNNLERMHLIKRKDLDNIEHAFHLLHPSLRHTNDYISVESWVQEMRPTGLIRYYKGQHQDSPIDARFSQILAKEDFFLVISNDHQLDMLKRFGTRCICIDGTHGLNGYGFELTTVVILDDLNEGFPAAFLISNRTDGNAMKLFFEVIAEAIGEPFVTDVLMSDMAETYYNGWVNVFPEPKKRLFCSWHVDRAWRKNLNKIKNSDRKGEVYQELKTLVEERDSEVFKVLLEKLTEKWLGDADLRDFGDYFVSEYKSKYPSWAYCHRLHAGINTNMHIERMHKTLKYIYLHGSNVKRLDKTLHALVKFTRDKVFERIISTVRGKLSYKIRELRKRHTTAVENLTAFNVVESGNGVWDCFSSSGTEVYRVVKNHLKEPCLCQLRCDDCRECIHAFICACPDSSIKWNMCKHIHAVCSLQASIRPPDDNCAAEKPVLDPQDLELVIPEETHLMQELPTLVSYVSKESRSASEAYKEKVITQIKNVLEEATNSTTFEEFQTIENAMKPIIPTLRAVREKATIKFLPSTSSNKRKVEPQRQFAFTSKKKRGASKKSVAKPSQAQKDAIALGHLLASKD